MSLRMIRGQLVELPAGAIMGAEMIDPRESLRSFEYERFLEQKQTLPIVSGLTSIPELHPQMSGRHLFQHDVTSWALRLGRSAVFLGTGLGKTLIELEWAKHISAHTDGPVLLLAPLAVAQQTVEKEAPKFGFQTRIVRHQSEVGAGINVTNYDRIDDFDASKFAGVVCDESSILKSMDGKTRSQLIEMFARTPYKLCATATPAPNDYMELGNHSEFLGVMTATEMLSMFFVHDGGDTQKWRLKGHARKEFWKWVCSWAVSMRKPSDIGYDDEGFTLPPKYEHFHTVQVDERHICPLQLEVIRRGVKLWSNPGDTIYDPFAVIGSTGVVALEMERKFLGSELKRSYWNQAVANCEYASNRSDSLFGRHDDAIIGDLCL